MEEEDDEEEEDKKGKKGLPPAFLKNIKKKSDSQQSRIDALEGQLAIATRLLSRQDKVEVEVEDDEEDDEELMDSLVQETVGQIFTAYQDAQDYLPIDFRLDSVTSPYEIMHAAIANFDSELAEKLDSEEAILGAYQVLKTYAGSPAPGVAMLRNAVDSAQGSQRTNLDSVRDLYQNAWKGGN
jgi:hypothetical protein